MLSEIDLKSNEPLQYQLARLIKKDFIDKMEVGAKLPPLKQICSYYSIGFGVAQEAFNRLREQGLIFSKVGSGTFITRNDSKEGILSITLPQFMNFNYSWTFKQLIAAYKNRNPGIKIEIKATPGDDFDHYLDYIDQDETDVALVLDSHITEQKNILRPVDGEEEREILEHTLDYVPELFRLNGRLYAWPLLFSPNIIICNRRHFSNAGLIQPGAEWNINDFDAAIARLEAANPGCLGFGMPVHINRWFNFLLNTGMKLNSSQTAPMPQMLGGSFRKAATKIKKYYAPPHGLLHEQHLLYAMRQGKVSMIAGSYFSTIDVLRQYQSSSPVADFFFQTLPLDQRRQTMLVGAGAGICRKVKHPGQALDFCRFVFSGEAQQIILDSSCGLPVIKNIIIPEEKNVAGIRLSNYTAFRHYQEHKVIRASRNDAKWTRFINDMTMYWCGLKTIEEVIEDTNAQ